MKSSQPTVECMYAGNNRSFIGRYAYTNQENVFRSMDRYRASVCVCVCVCIIGGERERAPYLDEVNGGRVCPYFRTYVHVRVQ